MSYIHLNNYKIEDFVAKVISEKGDIRAICKELFIWFDNNVEYSRLNAPFFPLQRSDLDVLNMKSGTCGDYSNFMVSVLATIGFETKYAYVHRDCYGDLQDHICAAVREENRWILIDATQPYRKWHGFDCPHLEYDLMSADEFEAMLNKEETYWTVEAEKRGNRLLAGLLYAPWIHEEIISDTVDKLDSVLFLVTFEGQNKLVVYAYYKQYTKAYGRIPLMISVSGGTQKFFFSIHEPKSIWENEQWGEAFYENDIPDDLKSCELNALKKCISEVLPRIEKILHKI